MILLSLLIITGAWSIIALASYKLGQADGRRSVSE